MIPKLLAILAIFSVITVAISSTECVWATGKVACLKNQTLVTGATIEMFDLDSPQNSKIKNPLDPDDKVAFTTIDNSDGFFNIEGCASDNDWFPGIKNKPEMYFRVFHYCNKPQGEYKIVLPIFRVFVPQTYDKHINDPIILDN